jgi:hypothetical protein
MTERTITSTAPGPIALALDLAAGTIHIDCGPHNFEARVTIKTTATSGPSADAIRDATVKQDNRRLAVKVASPAGSGGGVFIGGDNHGSISVGGISGMTVIQSGGSTHISGGGRVFVNGVEVGAPGDQSCAATPIEIWAYLPAGSAADVKTKAADAYTTGHLGSLDYEASSGSLHAASVGELDAGCSSGGVSVEEVTGGLSVTASSGSVRVGAYSGSNAVVTASSGSISLHATRQATGRLRVTASSGSIRLTGTSHLDVRHRVSSGSVRIS